VLAQPLPCDGYTRYNINVSPWLHHFVKSNPENARVLNKYYQTFVYFYTYTAFAKSPRALLLERIILIITSRKKI
jgi:hypothetical protein